MISVIKRYIKSISKCNSHGSRLEEYILSKNPQSVGDIERLTKEYDQLITRRRFI